MKYQLTGFNSKKDWHKPEKGAKLVFFVKLLIKLLK